MKKTSWIFRWFYAFWDHIFFAENDFFKPTHPTKMRKIPPFFFETLGISSSSLHYNGCMISWGRHLSARIIQFSNIVNSISRSSIESINFLVLSICLYYKGTLILYFVCEGLRTTSGILINTPTTDDSRNTKNELDQAVIDTPHLFAY